MDAPQNNSLTPDQRRAVAARGNVLVMAGAGTGKTHTLVERCLDLICNDGISLDEILIVTFTEAAATEMRERLRKALENFSGRSAAVNLPEQLALFDAAHIGTLHSFCFKLIREHFHELGLDPQLSVLDEGQQRLLADEILDEQFESHYENEDAFSLAVQDLIRIYGGGRDESIRALVLRLHHYIQTRADAADWPARQIEIFSSAEPRQWREWFSEAVSNWREEWLSVLQNLKTENVKAAECLEVLAETSAKLVAAAPSPPETPDLADHLNDSSKRRGVASTLLQKSHDAVVGQASCLSTQTQKTAVNAMADVSALFQKIVAADDNYPARKKTVLRKPLEDFFDDAKFLNSLCATGSADPLAEDWNWIRGPMKTLLLLAREFSEKFSDRKHADGVLDFHDLEQFAIRLLWNFKANAPTAIAERLREKLRFVFVDEYQDINAAQDRIIAALGRENRFLVGDVKQSIYRFRLADPKIFREYAKNPADWKGQTLALAENFRSREPLLDFVNSLFEPLMREEIGGVPYDERARLKFGATETRGKLSSNENPGPRVELLLRAKTRNQRDSGTGFQPVGEGGDALGDLQDSEKEARMLALHLRELKESGHKICEKGELRPAEWRDFAVLLRAPGSKGEIFARQFERAGVPLVVERGGFYDSSEISDLLSLLQLADNPLQDVPCIAVLRSPLVGCSLEELAEIRLAGGGHFWFALNRVPNSKIQTETREKVGKFLERFSRWRKLAQQTSLSRCLEEILAETRYDDWLLSRPRGQQRRANVEKFLHLAEQFDAFQRQGLFRFLKFVEAQREIEAEPEAAPSVAENAVRLMSIHQSKGREFPIVALADLGKNFNERDLRGEIILDEQFGLCPRVKPPSSGGRYPSLAYWLAQKNQRRELRGEELRLLYVALTRARDTLVLSGSVSAKKWEMFFQDNAPVARRDIVAANSCMDWLGLWFKTQAANFSLESGARGELPLLCWRAKDDSDLAEPSVSPKKRKATGAVSLDELAQKIASALDWKYPFRQATQLAAKTSVTALRRQEELDNEAEQKFQPRFGQRFSVTWRAGASSEKPSAAARLNAADTGVAHHKFLQHFSLDGAADLKFLAAEARRLEKENYLSADEAAALDLDALAHFWSSDIGGKILANCAFVRRELAFTAGFKPAELDEIFGQKPSANLDNEIVVVQGLADLVALLPDEIWLLDFKTDDVKAKDLPERMQFHAPQLKLYARALEKIYSRPVANRWLHFLSARKTFEIQ